MQESVQNSVQRHRKNKGITQQDLAQRVGVSRQTIISIEKGGYVPSLALAFRIANFFGVKIEDIFKIEEK